MRQIRTEKKSPLRKSYIPPLLLAAAFLLTGCAPEEKTLLLITETLPEEETESADSSRDFTVKKIYTYAYETMDELGQSAFLKDCAENEIGIIVKEEQEDCSNLVYRQVDYRFGFYDAAGTFFQSWQNWLNPPNQETDEHLYIEKLIPSPDGKQLLAYIRDLFWDNLIVRLYPLGAQEPWILYEGQAESDWILKGSFSPSGRWMTFDAFGYTNGAKRLTPIYDCQKESSATSSLLRAPDQMLYTARACGNPVYQWLDAQLYDHSGSAELLCLIREKNDGFITVTLDYRIDGADLLDAPSEHGLSDSAELDVYGQSAFYLYGYAGLLAPYLQYTFAAEEGDIYYLEEDSWLWIRDSKAESPTMIREFPTVVWGFLRLDSGDFLAAAAQELGLNQSETANAAYMDKKTDTSILPHIQAQWDILSADLYLYPADGTEGILLYKNLQNLIHMEYDEESRRILLETYENRNLSHRRCIILEL